MGQLGLGVMIQMLGGSSETVTAIKSKLNITFDRVELRDDVLTFHYDDDSELRLWDGGQSCCESRYMIVDDKLEYFAGAKILDVQIRSADSIPTEYKEHEIQFLDVTTDKGVIQACTHNEHNGYYGGFWIQAEVR